MMGVSREYITAAQAHHRPLRVNKTVLRFSKDRLPPARPFYETELGTLTRASRKGWCLANCPSHDSRSRKSFAINIETGAFHCWGCDARGGDIVDFLQYRYNLSFKEACRKLGAWDKVGQPAPPPVMVPVRYLTFDYDIDGLHYSVSVKDEPPNYASMVRRFYLEANDRLTELGRSDHQAYIGEQETCWARLALGLDELRELEIAS